MKYALQLNSSYYMQLEVVIRHKYYALKNWLIIKI